ncbi:MAG: HNH endonuclease [Candidatus Hadarchaeum sp.]
MEAIEDKTILLPKERRVKSRIAIQRSKKPYCELCGKPASGEPHHIRYRSQGGSDIPENLIQLCFNCHRAVHDGKISRDELLRVVASREGRKKEEIAETIGIGHVESENTAIPSSIGGRLAQYSLEDLLQLYANITEEVDNTHWERGAILVILIDGMGQKPSWIASKVGASAAQIRELAKTFRAFPEESSRAKDLSWFHHRLAANTDNPQKWIQLAAQNQWSTRQMRENIKLALNVESKKDQVMAKAEKAVRFTEEVLGEGGEAAGWLKSKLAELLRRSDKNAPDIATSL